jgi:integrase
VASIYKDKKTGKYKIAYYPVPHIRKVVIGCQDYKACEALARKLEADAMLRREGVIDARAEKFSHSEQLPLAKHLTAFEAALRGKGSTEKHIKGTLSYIRAMVAACDFAKPMDLDAAKVGAYVSERKQQGAGARAINAKLTALKSFSRWLFRTERMRSDPMMQVAKLNANMDRRHQRRPLSDAEVLQLITTVASRPGLFDMAGLDRAMLYRLAVETGLRAGEIASLTPGSFDLRNLDNASVKVAAAYSKHRRDDEIPIRCDLAQAVAEFIKDRPANKALFAMPEKPADMLKVDLRAARAAWIRQTGVRAERRTRRKSSFLSYRDASDQVADFHALRHTFITRLAQSNVAPSVAKTLARHSTITLTMDHYTHTLIGDSRAALESLPAVKPADLELEEAEATGTDGPSVGNRIAPQIAFRVQNKSSCVTTCQEFGKRSEGQNKPNIQEKTGTCQRMTMPVSTAPRWTRTIDPLIKSPYAAFSATFCPCGT